MSKEFRIPLKVEVQDCKVRFEALNNWIRARDGWLVSVPGDPDMRFEALPGSTLPDQLRAAGYEVTEIGTAQRILPHAVEQKWVVGPAARWSWRPPGPRGRSHRGSPMPASSPRRFTNCARQEPCHRARG